MYLCADSDIAYSRKPVWESFLSYILEYGADGAFQAEPISTGPVNLGNYVVLPTKATIDLFNNFTKAALGSAITAGDQVRGGALLDI